MDEAQAIGRLKRGDIHGLEALVRIHQLRAVQAAFLVTRDRPLAEDIVQAAFLRAYERIHQFDADRPFGPWFLRSVVNDALKAVTRRKRQVSLEAELGEGGDLLPGAVQAAEPSPEAQVELAETRREVWDAMARLAPSQRAAVVLRYFLDLSEAEVASQLGCPRGTVKRRLHTARKRLGYLLMEVLPGRQRHETPAGPHRAEASPTLSPSPCRGGKE
ncbi:MAG: sigma-70 family RNA polymerase sigma factor [Dehalococcoidales bacterium]|nr:sigma-70 family RNA polymerase sigma factor [Dehalococcoidales bacterium]